MKVQKAHASDLDGVLCGRNSADCSYNFWDGVSFGVFDSIDCIHCLKKFKKIIEDRLYEEDASL